MPVDSKIKDWHQVLAAIVTVAGGLLLVWWQTGQASSENKQMLVRFTETVQNSNQLRQAVLRPLEGRWSYSLKWETYFHRDSAVDSLNHSYESEGNADIRWYGGAYQILLGYENRDTGGNVYSVGVSTGTLRAPSGGLPAIGDAMIMRYAHRLSIGEIKDNTQGVIDYNKVPEKSYQYTIQSYELGSDGSIAKIHVRFETSQSKGNAVFTREQ